MALQGKRVAFCCMIIATLAELPVPTAMSATARGMSPRVTDMER